MAIRSGRCKALASEFHLKARDNDKRRRQKGGDRSHFRSKLPRRIMCCVFILSMYSDNDISHKS